MKTRIYGAPAVKGLRDSSGGKYFKTLLHNPDNIFDYFMVG